MRQVKRPGEDMVLAGWGRGGGRRDRVSQSQPPAAAPTTTNAMASQIATAEELNDGKSVVITRVPDSTSSTAMISPARTFSHRGFTQGPSTTRSLQRSNRN